MTTRRLAAILAADVVGFSSMMEKDEEGTLRRVKALQREVIEPKVRERGGRLVKTTGDGFLCEFGSPVEAVRCALEVHEATKANGASDLILRMGINLGDIIVEPDGDIYGEGVNVAARLEQLAEPGSIWLSEEIHRHVSGKIDRSFQERGEQQVKNIARPVRVYAVSDATRPVSQPKPLPLPDKPSIAVLPFTNMSGDPEQEYFADGVVEDIITALSRVKSFFVVARNSSFTFKGRAVDMREVGRQLGVRYILEGSIRRSGKRLRITGQLIEAESHRHVWADKFDGELEDVFELQDRITEAVVGAIEPTLIEAELQRSRAKPTSSLAAYDFYIRACLHVPRLPREDNEEALRLAEQAWVIDPRYARAYALAAQARAQRIHQSWTADRDAEAAIAAKLARTALAYGDDDPEVLWRCAVAFVHAGERVERSVPLAEKAVLLNPNSSQALHASGWVQVYSGGYVLALERFSRAMRLSPLDPFRFLSVTGMCAAHLLLEEFEAAVTWGREALALNPNFHTSYRFLAASYAQLGKLDEARSTIRELLKRAPDLTVASVVGVFGQSPNGRVYLDGLRKAGLPE